MTTLAFAMQKGGVGKTTTTLALRLLDAQRFRRRTRRASSPTDTKGA